MGLFDTDERLKKLESELEFHKNYGNHFVNTHAFARRYCLDSIDQFRQELKEQAALHGVQMGGAASRALKLEDRVAALENEFQTKLDRLADLVDYVMQSQPEPVRPKIAPCRCTADPTSEPFCSNCGHRSDLHHLLTYFFCQYGH